MVFIELKIVVVVGAVQTVQNFVMTLVMWDIYPKSYPIITNINQLLQCLWDMWDKSFEQVCSKFWTGFRHVSRKLFKVLDRLGSCTKSITEFWTGEPLWPKVLNRLFKVLNRFCTDFWTDEIVNVWDYAINLWDIWDNCYDVRRLL